MIWSWFGTMENGVGLTLKFWLNEMRVGVSDFGSFGGSQGQELIILGLMTMLLIVYLIDINYFIRAGIVFFQAFFLRRRLGFMESSVVYGTVLPFDSDLQITHMNNARVLREYDFGRMDFCARTGLLDEWIRDTLSLKLKRPQLLAVATVTRYRQPLQMFMKYKIISKPVYWEDKMLYLEHETITVDDGIIRNIGYMKLKLSFDIDTFLKKYHPGVVKPEMPEDISLWIQFNSANGLKTRAKEKINNDNGWK